jgi:hypothetical protein
MLTVRRAPIGWLASIGVVAVTAAGAYAGSVVDVDKCRDEPSGKVGQSICSSLGDYSHKGALLVFLLVAPPVAALLFTRTLPSHRTRAWILLLWGAVIAVDALLRSLIISA